MRISDWSSDVCSSDLIDAQEQALDARQSNAFAILRGTGARASLMLYAPTDTVTSNSADEDTPWAAAELLPEMRAEAVVADGLISGLGAHRTEERRVGQECVRTGRYWWESSPENKDSKQNIQCI